MAAPKTDSLKYYSRDTSSQDNELYVEAVHGPLGYYIVEKLRSHIYGSTGGYYCEFGELNKRLFCKKNCGISMDDLEAVLQTCFNPDVNLYNKEMYERHNILTSAGIQKRWKTIVMGIGRKNNHINESYLLIPQETIPKPSISVPLSVDNVGMMPVLTTQKKRKERKLKENNKPSQKAPVVNRSLNQKIWEGLIQTWVDFNLQKFKEKPSFTATDGKKLKSIAEKLQKRAVDKNQPWSIQDAGAKFLMFLNDAYACNDWLAKNFLLKNIDSQFDAIVMDQAGKATKARVVKAITIEALKLKFIDNTITMADVQQVHYEELKPLGCVITDNHYCIARTKRAEELIISNKASDHQLANHYLKNETTSQTKQDKHNIDMMAMRYAVRDWLYTECVLKE